MYYSFKGYVDLIKTDYIVLDVHDVCYQINVSHPNDYSIDELVRVFIYQVVREDEQYLVGFKDLEEKEIFTSLISVKGIGPRTAISALSHTTPAQLKAAIVTGNVSYLKKLPGIGSKAASQIILDLKGDIKIENKKDNILSETALEAKLALKELGFKVNQIDEVLNKVNTNQDISLVIKDCLKILG